MFYFRINKIKIPDAKENSNYSIKGSESAPLKMISFITTENSVLPDMSYFLHTTDFSKKKILLHEAIETVVSSRIYTEIENIKENHTLVFGSPGYILFKSSQIPNQFDWQFIAYENGIIIQEGKQLLDQIIHDKNFDNFTNNLSEVLQSADNPSHTAAINIARYAIDVSSDLARKHQYDLLGVSSTSLSRHKDYVYGGGRRDRISDINNNLFVDYSIFGYDE